MNPLKNHKLTKYSQNLRKNMTKEERRLWYDFLKTMTVPVYRQKVLGPYIVDFYCAAADVVIELDGSQHYEEMGKVKDAQRDEFFNRQGITVLRYSNADVNMYFERVCEDILLHLSSCGKEEILWKP